MQQLPEEPNISIRISPLNNILKSSASLHVGRTKPSNKPKPWINPQVRAKIRNRNRHHRTIHQNRQEWIDACQKQTSLSTKPRPIAGRIPYTVPCQTLTTQMHEKSSKASTAHQILTRPMKSCLITGE